MSRGGDAEWKDPARLLAAERGQDSAQRSLAAAGSAGDPLCQSDGQGARVVYSALKRQERSEACA